MAAGSAGESAVTVSNAGTGSYTGPLILMLCLWFGIGFITALNDVLVAHFKDLFHLSNSLALLVQFCFFFAYFVMSLPSGAIVGRIGYKNGMLVALGTMVCGLLLFVPASIVISYPLFLFALFVVGSGLALLQVALNPYISALGKPETAASRMNLGGGFNSLATTIAPTAGAYFIFVAAGASQAELAKSVRMPYIVVAGLTLLLAIITRFVHLPELIAKQDAKTEGQGSALQFRHLKLGAVAIFTYVGAEVAIGSILIPFLGQPSMGSIPHEAAAHYVTLYWGGAMVGRFLGSFAMGPLGIRTERALAAVTMVAFALVLTGILGHGHVAMWALVSVGLFNSVMWPCIFPLGVRGLGAFTSQGSGIMVTMVVGGAIIPVLQGLLADKFGYQPSFAIVLACYAYLIYFALSGYRIRQPRFPSIPDYVPPIEV